MSLSCAPWGAGGEGSLERGEPGAAARGPKVQREQAGKWLDYIGKSSPDLWAGEFRLEGRACRPEGPYNM